MRRKRRSAGLVALILAALMALGSSTALAQKTRLVFATRSGVEREQLARTLIEEFEAMNPDIEIEWLGFEASTYADKMAALAAAGEAPDVFEAWGSQGVDWAEAGMLLDLAPFVERDLTAAELDDIIPSVWEATVLQAGERAGMRFAVPRYLNVIVFYYNQTLFDQAGLIHLDTLDQMGDWTWDRLVEYGKRLTQRNADGTYRTYGLLTDRKIERSAAWVWASGGNVFNHPENPTEFALDSPQALNGLQFLYDLRWTHDVWPVGAQRLDVGVTGMDNARPADGLRGRITSIGDQFDWDIAPRPMGPAGRGTRTSLDMYVASSSTDAPEAVWRFMKYLISREAQLHHAVIQGMIPIRKSLYQDYLSLFPEKSVHYFYEGALEAHVDPMALIPRAAEARSLIDNALAAAIDRNEKDVRTAIAEIAGAVRALYE